MSAPSDHLQSPVLALFDLDGTLTRHDTLLPYLLGYAARHPLRLLRLWRMAAALCRYLSVDRDRGVLKSGFIRAVMGGDSRTMIDQWSDAFVQSLASRGVFRPAGLAVLEAHRKAGDRLVLLSASPDLYVPRIGHLLGFGRTMCTELNWTEDRLEGSLKSQNRLGEEKVRCLEWLRAQHPGLPVIAYGNSESDLPHLRRADRALLVNAGAAARLLAAAAGIPVADWR